MAKYVVIKELVNVRNHPSISDESFIGTLGLGEIVNLRDDLIVGEVPEGTDDNMWHSDELNRYISRPAVAPIETFAAKKAAFIADSFNEPFIDKDHREDETKWKISWGHVDLEIWRIWKEYKTMGEGVRIAIIDSGIGSNIPDLNNVVKTIYPPLDGGSVNDELGHGTLTAGIIGATGNSVVFGIAPKCELTIIKREGKNGILSEAIDYESLKAVGKDIDILNISLEFVENTQRISEELTRIANQGTLIIAASGDGISKLNNNIFPANHPNVISITALDRNNALYFQALFNKNTKWIMPGEQILSCDLMGKRGFHDATSAAAPFMSGILSLFISLRKHKKLFFTNDQLFKLLSNSSIKISFKTITDSYSFCLPNLIEALSNVGSLK